jgi:2-haloacid dehalogenase
MLPVLPRRTLLIGAAASTVAAALPARAAADNCPPCGLERLIGSPL